MPAFRLDTRLIEKPWGRHDLPPPFADAATDGARIGEVWFTMPDGAGEPDLLVKYLFTSERLSIQVHPDDTLARAHGLPRGKDEAWFILAAAPDATIGIGTRTPMSADDLRAAIANGSIERKLDWKPVRAGDCYYSPARTVHAIGAGLALIEVQQNVDVTYRLYDYGRPRELHLEEGIEAAIARPFPDPSPPVPIAPGRTLLARGGKLSVERWQDAGDYRLDFGPTRFWLMPMQGTATVDGAAMTAGEVWIADAGSAVTLADGADLLLGY